MARGLRLPSAPCPVPRLPTGVNGVEQRPLPCTESESSEQNDRTSFFFNWSIVALRRCVSFAVQ